ncbi:MAG: hypothetical protein ACRD3W_22495 [Terriglobales bacterium]
MLLVEHHQAWIAPPSFDCIDNAGCVEDVHSDLVEDRLLLGLNDRRKLAEVA